MATHSRQVASLSNNTLRSLPSEICPRYDRNAIKTGIIHLGVGAFHRARRALTQRRCLLPATSDGESLGLACAARKHATLWLLKMVSTPWQSVARPKGFK